MSSSSSVLNYTFSVEDTSEGCYRDIGQSLLALGWRKRDRSKWKRKTPPLLKWTIAEKDINFQALQPWQICNHFEGISEITTKMGFCDLLREAPWIGENPRVLSPRCYNIGDPVHREEFVDDFYLTACASVLKAFVLCRFHGIPPPSSSAASSPHAPCLQEAPAVVLRHAIRACAWQLKNKLGGEWPEVDRTFDTLDGTSANCVWNGLNTREINMVLAASYGIAETTVHWDSDVHLHFPSDETMMTGMGTTSSCKERGTKVLLVLQGLRRSNPQFDLDGLRNVWIVKAPDACQGVGLKVLHRLEDILDCERGMGGRTVQKYVETPLLASPSTSSSLGVLHPTAMVKFDLRVWVLVTSVTPLKAVIFSNVYGRCCSQPYDLNVSTLNDALVHLTNYSIQRAKGNTSGADRESALLMSHGQVLDVVANRAAALHRHRPHSFWHKRVWPAMKRKVGAALELAATCGSLVHRDRSFEFLGVDILLDERLRPWVLEVNMSPAMAHRSTAQSGMIRGMAHGLVDHAITPIVGVPPANDEDVDQSELGTDAESGEMRGGGMCDDTLSSDGEETKGGGNEEATVCDGKWETLHMKTEPVLAPAPLSVILSSSSSRPGSALDGHQRPRSSNGTRSRVSGLATDVTFAVAGVAIASERIRVIDQLCRVVEKRKLLGEWMLRYLVRTREYHERRRCAAVVLQCTVRRFVARRRMLARLRCVSTTLLQKRVRILLAQLERIRRLKQKSAVLLQVHVRCLLSRKEAQCRRANNASRRLQRWYNHHRERFRRKHAFKITWHAKSWVKRRFNAARRVRACIALHFHWWRRRHILIQRRVRRWIVRTRQRRFHMLRTLKFRAIECREGARKMAQRRIRRLRSDVYDELKGRFELPQAAQKTFLKSVYDPPCRPQDLKLAGASIRRHANQLSFSLHMEPQASPASESGESTVPRHEHGTGDGEVVGNGTKQGFLFDFVGRYSGALSGLRVKETLETSDRSAPVQDRENEGTEMFGKNRSLSLSTDCGDNDDDDDYDGGGGGVVWMSQMVKNGEVSVLTESKAQSKLSRECETEFQNVRESHDSWSVSSPRSAMADAPLDSHSPPFRQDVRGNDSRHNIDGTRHVAPSYPESCGGSFRSTSSGRKNENHRHVDSNEDFSESVTEYYKDTWGNLRRKTDDSRVRGNSNNHSSNKESSGSHHYCGAFKGQGGLSNGKRGSASSRKLGRSACNTSMSSLGTAATTHVVKPSSSSRARSCTGGGKGQPKSRHQVGSSEDRQARFSSRIRKDVQAAAALGGLTGYVEAASTESRLRHRRHVPDRTNTHAHPLAYVEPRPLTQEREEGFGPTPPPRDVVGAGRPGRPSSTAPTTSSPRRRSMKTRNEGSLAPAPVVGYGMDPNGTVYFDVEQYARKKASAEAMLRCCAKTAPVHNDGKTKNTHEHDGHPRSSRSRPTSSSSSVAPPPPMNGKVGRPYDGPILSSSWYADLEVERHHSSHVPLSPRCSGVAYEAQPFWF